MFVCSLLNAEIGSGKLSLNTKTAPPACPQDPKAEASLRRSELPAGDIYLRCRERCKNGAKGEVGGTREVAFADRWIALDPRVDLRAR